MKGLLASVFSIFIYSSCTVASPSVKLPPVTAPKTKASSLSKTETKTASEDFKNEFLTRLNKLRAEGCNCGNQYMPPAPPVAWNNMLELAALGHAQDMNRNNYFDHVSKDGKKLKDRLFATGYTYDGFKSYFIGENIALGQRSIKEVMNGWIASEHHCENLMNPKFKEVGIALVNSYWVQDFGARNPFEQQKKRGFW